MEHKDIWLVLGLTIVLAVAVSISTVSLTGDSILSVKKLNVQKAPITSIKQIDLPATYSGVKDMLNKCTGGSINYWVSDTAITCNELCDSKDYMAPQKGKKCIFGLLKTSIITLSETQNEKPGQSTFNNIDLVNCDQKLSTTELLGPEADPYSQLYVQCRCC